MSHIFIAYSRVNRDLAIQLKQALENSGRSVWIDLEDLPPSSMWRLEIKEAIEGCITFIYLLSPDSIASRYCRNEFDYAREMKKKVIPILLFGMSDQDIPDHISEIQWLRWDEFGENLSEIEKLQKIIDHDYEWAKFHAELTSKAKRWERIKDTSRLIRGKELRETERKLAEFSGQENPQLTKLLREYVLFSRKDEDRSRNRLVIMSFVTSIFMLMLLLLTLWQLHLSEARRLAAVARANLQENNSFLAAAIAAQSLMIAQTDEGYAALAESLYFPLANGTYLFAQAGTVYDIAWSPTGVLASANENGSVIIWELDYGRPARILEGHHGSVFNVTWSPDGRLASGGMDSRVIIWDLISGAPDKVFETGDITYDLAWSPDGKKLAVSSGKDLQIWDVKNGNLIQTIFGVTQWVFEVDWLNEDQLVYGSHDSIVVWDTTSNSLIRNDLIGLGWDTSIGLSPDGYISVSNGSDTIIIIEAATGIIIETLNAPDESLFNANWLNGEQLVSTSRNEIIIWNNLEGEINQILKGHTQDVVSVEWSKDGKLASSSHDGVVILWDLESAVPGKILRGHNSNILEVAWSQDGHLATGAKDGAMLLWAPDGQVLMGLTGHESYIIDIEWSPENQLASTANSDLIFIWDTETGEHVQILRGHSDIVTSLAWSNEGKLVSGSFDGRIIIWDLDLGKPAQILMNPSGEVQSVVWSADGRLASGGWREITIWDIAAGQPMKILRDRHSQWIFDLDWHGDRLVSGGSDGIIGIWDINGEKASYLKAHTGWGSGVALSPDGNRLATGNTDRTVYIWDLSNNQPQVIFKDRTETGVISVAWSNSGNLAYADKRAVHIIPSFRAHRLCDWLPRNLTFDEWKTYIGGISGYQPACSNIPYGNFVLSGQKFYSPTDILVSTRGRIVVGLIAAAVLLFLIAIISIVKKLILKVVV